MEAYKKFKLPNGKYKNFYKFTTPFTSKKRAEREMLIIRNMHKMWNHQLYYRIIKIKNKWGEIRFIVYMYSTEPNYMQGFRRGRYYKK